MHNQARIALAHPCFHGEQTTNPLLHWRPTLELSATLTVNIGME